MNDNKLGLCFGIGFLILIGFIVFFRFMIYGDDMHLPAKISVILGIAISLIIISHFAVKIDKESQNKSKVSKN